MLFWLVIERRNCAPCVFFSRAGTRFTVDDVRPAAGFGIGLDDRTFRIDFAWPLRPLDGNSGPSIQLRISPTF